ncbi:MAG: flavodoxin family protein, partial [Candidatus Electrothrix sp. AX2]|nr:flavodoxin family protein [Candidatus Electrothrix gigas]
MKIIGVAASPRENKSTRFLLEQCLDAVKSTGEASERHIEVESIDLAPLKFQGCIACDACKKGVLCSQQDDF